MTHRLQWIRVNAGAVVLALASACRQAPAPLAPSRVLPGISVLLRDSIQLVRNRRIGLLTNQTGVDERGVHDIDRLTSNEARAAGVVLVTLFSPEHGIRGTEDRENLASGIDARTGLPIISLYTTTAIAPPDSALRNLGALVVDLQDIGTRTWTYEGSMLYALRAGARNHVPVIVLDRPNPITGLHVSGPVLDSAIANAEEDRPGRPARAYALYPLPLRHGLTMGEMARFFADALAIPVELHVVPAAGWRRAMWFDQTGLPWVRPSPNMPDLTSALLYPALVAFEATSLSVGRGTPDAFQRFGAPWMDAPRVTALLAARRLPGLSFAIDSFTPSHPGDGKYGGVRIPGVHITVTARDSVDVGRLGATVLWALGQTGALDSLRIAPLAFDLRFGSAAARQALVRGADPDGVMAAERARLDVIERRLAPTLQYP